MQMLLFFYLKKKKDNFKIKESQRKVKQGNLPFFSGEKNLPTTTSFKGHREEWENLGGGFCQGLISASCTTANSCWSASPQHVTIASTFNQIRQLPSHVCSCCCSEYRQMIKNTVGSAAKQRNRSG